MSTDTQYIPALRYRVFTPVYDHVVRWLTRERRFKMALMKQAGLHEEQEVLDLGCGTGTLAIWMKRHYPAANVTGIDGDGEILKLANRKATIERIDIRFDEGMSFALPYSDSSFDRVVSTLFFHHLTTFDKLRTAREVFRVMRPGSEFHVADWGRPGGSLMKLAFLPVRILDGFETTRDSIEGVLPDILSRSGFDDVAEPKRFVTPLGIMSLYRAYKAPA